MPALVGKSSCLTQFFHPIEQRDGACQRGPAQRQQPCWPAQSCARSGEDFSLAASPHRIRSTPRRPASNWSPEPDEVRSGECAQAPPPCSAMPPVFRPGWADRPGQGRHPGRVPPARSISAGDGRCPAREAVSLRCGSALLTCPGRSIVTWSHNSKRCIGPVEYSPLPTFERCVATTAQCMWLAWNGSSQPWRGVVPCVSVCSFCGGRRWTTRGSGARAAAHAALWRRLRPVRAGARRGLVPV